MDVALERISKTPDILRFVINLSNSTRKVFKTKVKFHVSRMTNSGGRGGGTKLPQLL